MRRSPVSCLVAVLVAVSPGFAQGDAPFQQRSVSKTIKKDVSLRYYVHTPNNYREVTTRFPLLLYLHGGLGRGDDFQKLAWYPIPKMILEGSFPDSFVVVVPQCPAGQLWTEQTDALLSVIDEVTKQYRIDTSRIYGMGYSMGGNGIAYLTYAHPDIFAAIAPMSGVYNPWWVSRIKNIPAWFFHGAKDEHVSVEEAEEMVREYRKEGAEPRYSRDPERGHRPPSVKEHLDVLRWFLEHSAKAE